MLKNMFNIDALALIMTSLVAFLTLVVGVFGYRYLQGDRKQGRFTALLIVLAGSLIGLFLADHIILFAVMLGLSQYCLCQLMLHKSSWEQAKNSAALARKNFLIGFASIATALVILYSVTEETSIQQIMAQAPDSPPVILAIGLLFVGALAQSAIYPFHKWLISSLNSPTPVSAMMHAGMINGGGFILVRFAKLYLHSSPMLTILLIAGFASAVLGTFWKLMQCDVKRMLACSTLGQMGFMILQCGLGLFASAITHLVWHGIYKAYLFLSTGSVVQEKRYDPKYPPSLARLALSSICGLVSAWSYYFVLGPIFALDTSIFMGLIVFFIGTQSALSVVQEPSFKRFLTALFLGGVVGAVYRLNVALFKMWLAPLGLMDPQPLNIAHIAIGSSLVACWLASILRGHLLNAKQPPQWVLSMYVKNLNASQPHPETVTAQRNHYNY